MRVNFCTLFDSFYLTRGLAMYRSLEKHSADFHLYIFSFDKTSFDVLMKMKLSSATIIALSEFESPELLSVKGDRTQAEYCWTSTPSTISYCIKKFNLDHCIYLDADLYFYRDPIEIIEKANGNSVIITPHNYTKKYDQAQKSGKYCVQFMYFKNDERGLKVLNWWKAACIDWCYARHENGKFGDQKYLDDWTTRFEGIYSSTEIGIGLAPWNVQQIDIEENGLDLKLKEETANNKYPLYFYHFHGVKILENNKVDFSDYILSKDIIDRLYIPYISDVLEQYKKVIEFSSNPNLKSIVKTNKGFKYYKRLISRKVRGIWNIMDLS